MQNYRLLKPGEIVEEGDEYLPALITWQKVWSSIGKPVQEKEDGRYRRPVAVPMSVSGLPNSFDLEFTGYGWLMHDTDNGPFLFDAQYGSLTSPSDPLPLTRENLERARTEARQWLELLENLTPID